MNAEPNPATELTNEVEPTAAFTPMPVWLVGLLFTLLFLGAWYFDLFGGWFEAKVYPPYTSVADVQRYQPIESGPGPIFAAGRKVYQANCAVCHMDSGVGNPANGCPPLIDSEWTSHETPERLIMLISKGLAGPITVNGKVYNTGVMLAVGDSLPGDETQKAEQIAALVSYVRKHFGGLNDDVAVVAPDHTAAVRESIKSRTSNYTPEELLKVP